jgi:hypothetical protein
LRGTEKHSETWNKRKDEIFIGTYSCLQYSPSIDEACYSTAKDKSSSEELLKIKMSIDDM